MTRTTGTSNDDVFNLRQYLAEFLSDQKMLQTKVVDKIKKNILFSIYFLNRALYEMWKNMVLPDRAQIKCNTTHAL
jgi:hypothetical protein